MRTHPAPRLLPLALLLFGAAAAAQDDERADQSIALGDADIYPALRIDYLSNDNVRLAGPDEEKTAGSVVLVSPRVELVAQRRLLRLRARYEGRYAQGEEDPQDVSDHLLGLDVDAEIDKRRRLAAFAQYRRDHEPFGFNILRGRADEADEPVMFDEFRLGASFRYGVVDARGNVEGGLRVTSRSFTNLESITDGRDYVVVAPYGLFSYRLSGDTRALLELRYEDVTRDSGADDRDALSLFGGVEFAAGGRLRGSARLGATSTSYDLEAREEETIFAAETEIRYLIREYATLGLAFVRELDDTGTRREDGTLLRQTVADELTLSWEQSWSSRISHEAYVQRVGRDRACPEPITARLAAGLEIDYAVRRWLGFGVSLVAQRRDADLCEGVPAEDGTLEFDQRLVGVHVRATL